MHFNQLLTLVALSIGGGGSASLGDGCLGVLTLVDLYVSDPFHTVFKQSKSLYSNAL